MKRPEDRSGSTWLRYSHLGIQFCATFLAFVLAGTWGDGKLGTTPWLTVSGALVGMTAATYLLVREVGGTKPRR